jgi:hypothetical protein
MRRVVWLALALAIAIAAVGGCAKIVGADFSDPSLAGAGSACTVAQSGDALVRLGDFVPSIDRHDFCFTPDGASSSGVVPVIASQGGAFPQGVGYQQLAAPITLRAGSYRVDVQPAGHDCSGAPIATASICLASATTTTVALLGDGAGQLALGAFPESTAPASGARVRFVNAIAQTKLDLGRAGAAELPTNVATIFANVAFGASSAGASSDPTIDGNGYVALTPPAAELPFGAAPTGATAATLVTAPILASAHRYTIVATGSAADVRFPQELFVCDENDVAGAFTTCGGTPFDLTIDAFNPFLFGPLAVHSQLRRQPLIDAVSKLNSDVVCLAGMSSDADKNAMAGTALLHGFLYSVAFADTLDTPIDDPTDQNGQVPPPPTTAACAAPARASALDDLLSCLQASCSTLPNDPHGSLIEDPIVCMYESCMTEVTATNTASPECWVCAITQLISEPFADTATACKTNPKAHLTFNGASNLQILSRHPVRDKAQFVLPATESRAGLVRVTVDLPNGAELDVYCGQMTTPGDDTFLPYFGPYGNGHGNGSDAWRQELLLQTGKVVKYVTATSAAKAHRAIVAGQWNSGPSVPNVVGANNSESFAVLNAAFPQAAPPGYAQECVYCADNPILTAPGQTSTVRSTTGTYSMLSGIPVTDALATSIILKEPVIPYMGYAIPVSPYYGYRAKVRVRPR